MSAIKMRCVDLILVYLIGVVACRPQNIENIEARTVTAAPGVESPIYRLYAWQPLAHFSTPSPHQPSSSQFYRFPKYNLSNSAKTLQEYRDLLKKLSLDEPRNFFNKDKRIKDQKTSIERAKEELRVLPTKTEQSNIKDVSDTSKQPSLAPYRFSPLFHFISNNNTIEANKIIKLRTSNLINENDITTLILKPQATAVAGVEGKAVSNPLSKAILREGIDVDILFEPAAVAIAGPGGVAHAQSDLEISYEY